MLIHCLELVTDNVRNKDWS